MEYSIPKPYKVIRVANKEDLKVIDEYKQYFMYLVELDKKLTDYFIFDENFLKGIIEFLSDRNKNTFHIKTNNNKSEVLDVIITASGDHSKEVHPLPEEAQQYLYFLYDLFLTMDKFPKLLYNIQDCMKKSGHPVVIEREKIDTFLENDLVEDIIKMFKTVGELRGVLGHNFNDEEILKVNSQLTKRYILMYHTVKSNMGLLKTILPTLPYDVYNAYIQYLGKYVFENEKYNDINHMFEKILEDQNSEDDHTDFICAFDSVNIAHLKFLYDYISRDIKFQALKRAVVDCLEKIMPNNKEIKLLATKVAMSEIKF